MIIQLSISVNIRIVESNDNDITLLLQPLIWMHQLCLCPHDSHKFKVGHNVELQPCLPLLGATSGLI